MPAAQTIAFTTTATTFSLTIDSVSRGTWDRETQLDSGHQLNCTDNEIVVALDDSTYTSFTIYNTDTVTIDGVEWEGTIRELFDELKAEVFFIPYVSESTVAILQRTTVLTDAQIKALPTTAIQVIPAPGVGKMIKVHSATIVTNVTAGAYTGTADATLLLVTPDNNYLSGLLHMNLILTGANGGRDVATLGCPHYYVNATSQPITNYSEAQIDEMENQPVLLSDNYNGVSDYGGGNAANTLEITVFYSIIDL